jgi:hypothetical protein
MSSPNGPTACENCILKPCDRWLLMIWDRFRWVYCQLDNLRRCMPSRIQKALNELPVTLDETYERTLQGIPKQKSHHAHRLLQCVVVAIRPLRIEELAEIFAIEFGPTATSNLVDGWRPESPEEALLSACSTLSAIIDDQGSKIVQFSHFSVKEFLTSDRLQTSNVGNICQFYVPLEPAHTILARACLTVLLQMDEKVDKKRLATFPLAFYAAQHWTDHAKFEDVALQIQDSMELLFNPKEPYFRAWIWIRGVESYSDHIMVDHIEDPSPPSPRNTPLYYAVECGLNGVAKHLIVVHAEDANSERGRGWAPLHLASCYGMFDAARVLLDHGADVNILESVGWTPLHFASCRGDVGIPQLLLEYGANVNAQTMFSATPLWMASKHGHLELVRLLIDHGADVNMKGEEGLTSYQVATKYQHHDVAQLLLAHGAEKKSVESDTDADSTSTVESG